MYRLIIALSVALALSACGSDKDDAANKAEEMAEDVRDTAEAVAKDAKDAAEDLGEATKDAYGDAAAAAQDAYGEASDAVSSTVDDASTAAKNMADEAETAAMEAVDKAGAAAEQVVQDASSAANEAIDELNAATAAAMGATAAAAAGDDDPCTLGIEVGDNIAYSTDNLSVPESCTDVTVTITHTGRLPAVAMGHNWVLLPEDALQSVAQAGTIAGADADYVPDDERIVAATGVVGGGESDSVTFSLDALQDGVNYRYVCTFPGHWAVMQGTFTISG